MDAPTERTRVKRLNKRAKYDAETVHGILDAMPICNVGYVFNGAPYVTPTLQWREGDHVYWHGSSASRMLEACEDAQVCLTVSIIDGFVMARSAFNHSCNYRSVMVFGTARKVTDPAEKELRLRNFTEGLWPGRWDMLRPMTAQGTEGDDGALPAARRGLGQGPHRPAGRRRGGLCAADLGRRHSGAAAGAGARWTIRA